ncbi:DNA polymerase alpha catalytic subunit A, putative [Plasmodium berghei]|uniref:DNA polymerase n=2 Tax=Plasmodium berghei TaxID=5821 RepID=A0A509AH41_PLABA|nr:DNA polymerase alpha catalytic subunit A, putative [Plasmodium berghei ANKA]SCM19769.1 DNA polymerase alpha catalytic subunit A, putative [Plasmodium berghei]SCN23509.1 DNA polymerase alpha catalytic subunit A, putative [Plasmodium berghei]SCO59825.1 DNA polymerase alpha catalytic subunit A, putative [Plasmodium berghei]VUC54807.1 DNA polymerase alpha catalytic subunit A, putative [Plasmodium berghei ANKA]|eukprot:XP_034420632.1 DNA polymerase alpha catalytic subunit A, putative [Plasmodium berghei ANKA]
MSNVFDKIRKQRSKECKATDFYEVKNKNDDIYEVVDEDGYMENKNSLKSFIVGDDKNYDSSDDVILETVNYSMITKKNVEKESKPKRNTQIDDFIREKKIQKIFSSGKLTKDDISKTRNIEKMIEDNSSSSGSEESCGKINIKRKTRDSYNSYYNNRHSEYNNKNIYDRINSQIHKSQENDIYAKSGKYNIVNGNLTNNKTKNKTKNNFFNSDAEQNEENSGNSDKKRKSEIGNNEPNKMVKTINSNNNFKDNIKQEQDALSINKDLSSLNKNTKSDNILKDIDGLDIRIEIGEEHKLDEMNLKDENLDKENEDNGNEKNNVNESILKNKYEEIIINDDTGYANIYVFDICKHKNSIILFGRTLTKLKRYKSISIYIEDMDRCYYFLLNKNKKYVKDGIEITYGHEKYKNFIMLDFVSEFKKIREYHNIKMAKYKIVFRKNLNLSSNNEELYAKVLYSYNYDNISENFSKGDTYSSFYCCNDDIVENFIIKKNMKMPCWIKVKDLKNNFSNNIAYCYFDCTVTSKKNIFTLEKFSEKKNADLINGSNNNNSTTNSVNTSTISDESLKKIDNNNPNNFIDIDLNKLVIKVVSVLNEENNHEVFSICSLVDADGMKYINFFGICVKSNKKGLTPNINNNINDNKNGIYTYNRNNCKIFPSEKLLLQGFLNKIRTIDVDIYIGYNILNFDLEFIIHRCHVNNIDPGVLSRKKKLKKSDKMKVNKFSGTNSTGSIYNIVQNIKGRLIVDIYALSKDTIKLTSYSMDEIIDGVRTKFQEKVKQQTGSNNVGTGNNNSNNHTNKNKSRENIPNVFKDFIVNDINLINCSNIHLYDSEQILENNLNTYINSQIFSIYEIYNVCNVLQLIEKSRDLTKLSGYIWARSLLSYTSECIEYFLLHEYHKKKYITPLVSKKKQKIENDTNKSKNTAKYLGGLVLEPLCGYYDTYVLYLDFNSLYPSIIIEYNICFSTFNMKHYLASSASTSEEIQEDIEKKNIVYYNDSDINQLDNIDEQVGDLSNIDYFDKTKPGILPSILKQLVEKRAFIKKLIASEKNKEKKELLIVQSLSIKLISNSIYGCLGNTHNRFYAKYIASYITQKGRNLLQHTKFKVEKEFNLKVVYGDTDSIMIDTGIKSSDANNYKESLKLAHTIKNNINKNYKKLELDLECIFSKLLLLKKKKYACAKVIDPNLGKYEYEMKGINFIKRDFCKISKLIGNELLRIIFSNKEYKPSQPNSSNISLNHSDDISIQNDLSEQIHEYLRSVYQRIQNDEFDLEHYVITKKLTKNVNEYQEKNSLGHVLVAERMIKDGYNVCVNKEIQYCVCRNEDALKFYNKGNEKLNSSLCCFSVGEIKKYNLKIDKDYYIRNQILLPINRLCQYIEGTNVEKISSCFNIYNVKEIRTDEQIDESYLETNVLSLLSETEERFKNIHLKGFLNCDKCHHNIKPVIFIKYFRCNKCFSLLAIEQIRNYIFSFINHLCSTFYKQMYICNSCLLKTKRIFLKDSNNCPNLNCDNPKNSLKPILSKKYIYSILEYFLHLLKGNLLVIPTKLHEKGDVDNVNNNEKPENNSEKNTVTNFKDKTNTKTNDEPEEYATDINVSVCIGNGYKTHIINDNQLIKNNKKNGFKIESYDNICKNKELNLNITKGLQMKFPNISNFITYLNLKANIFCINYNDERNTIRESIQSIIQNDIYSQIFFDNIFSVFHLSVASKISKL